MRKIFLPVCFIALFVSSAFAHPYEAFNYVMSRYVTPDDSEANRIFEQFTKDVGQAIGGGSYGNSSGIDTFGFNMSIKMSYQQVTSENAIVNKNGDTAIYYPVVQGDFGLAEKLLGVARLSYSNDSYV
ncbi:MAG: hypothetical protein LBQ47_08480, partial [Endomicrobium sp.]|nr:hypothetical protein [Endomicrobium sp.]